LTPEISRFVQLPWQLGELEQLSDREREAMREVMALVGARLSNEEIAG